MSRGHTAYTLQTSQTDPAFLDVNGVQVLPPALHHKVPSLRVNEAVFQRRHEMGRSGKDSTRARIQRLTARVARRRKETVWRNVAEKRSGA